VIFIKTDCIKLWGIGRGFFNYGTASESEYMSNDVFKHVI